MRRKLLLLFGLILSCGMMAAPVTLQEAQQRAQQFLSRHGAAPHGMRLAKQQPRLEAAQQDNAYYYVFNVGQEQGFVIVSGDDRTPAILGYADQGSFADQDMPDNMRAWLQGYEEQMKWMEQAGYQAPAKAPNKVAKQAIGELLTTTWDQGKPYNDNCPIVPGTTSLRTVTGCVATAMAQVLAYQALVKGNSLRTTQTIAGYSCKTNWNGAGAISISDKSPITFDHSNMLPSYAGEYTDQQASAVATLMEYCGASVRMEYGPSGAGGSGANDAMVAPALRDYFGMDATYVSRSSYTYAEWVDLIYGELAQGRPVFYGGQSSGGGHAFVVDGYDGEELFHVNWGWGGSSNGYFVLSVLNSHNNSGIGASSSSDGYSFSQDATINVKPSASPTGEGNQLTFEKIVATGNTLTCQIGNYIGKTETFNLGIGYLRDGALQPLVQYNGTLDNGRYWIDYGFTISSSAISDFSPGTYTFYTISKVSTSSEWLTEMDGTNRYIEAVIDDSKNVTLTVHPTANLSVSDIEFTGSKLVGEAQPVVATIVNSGGEFYDQLYFFASQNYDSKGDSKGNSGATIPASGKTSMEFSFTPNATGKWYVWIATDEAGNSVIGQGEVEITEGTTYETSDDVALQISYEIVNSVGYKILGNKAEIKITITNPEDKNYSGTIIPYLHKYWSDEQYNYHSSSYFEIGFSINARATQELTCTFEKLEDFKTYAPEIQYIKAGTQTVAVSVSSERYSLAIPATIYAADGTSTLMEAADDMTVPTNAVAVDLSQGGGSNLTPGSNPNCLYFLAANATVPASLSDKNVVKGSTAESIVLTDGYDFYTPVAFTAQQISYTRTFTTGYATDGSGWSTITLPFAVSKVTAEDNEIDWFHGEGDTGKNFWVMAFDGDNGSTVNFTYASQMQANTPYIIAVPGSQYKPQWQLVNKPLTFSATDIQVLANAKAALTGNAYKFMGSFVGKAATSDYYVMNSEGTSFEKGSTAVEPFHAYFTPTSNSSQHSSLSITFVGGQTTAIEMLNSTESQASGGQIYDLQGRKVNGQASKGIYIINGKKYIKH